MKRIPIYIDGEITLHAIAQALNGAGFHVHSDRYGRTVVDQVPAFLRPEAATNVVELERKRRRRA